MDKSTYQIIIEEIQHVLTGAILNQASSHMDFYNSTIINSAYILNNVFRRLNLRAGTTCKENMAVLITIVALVAQTLLAYQRDQENTCNETIPLAEIGCNFIATAAPAIITYFQHCQAAGNQLNANNRNNQTNADAQIEQLNSIEPPSLGNKNQESITQKTKSPSL